MLFKCRSKTYRYNHKINGMIFAACKLLSLKNAAKSLAFISHFYCTIFLRFLEANSLCWARYQQNIRSGSSASHVPWCKSDGSFSPLQIQGSQFFCINERGDEIAGTSVDVSLGRPDCRAAGEFLYE